MYIYIYVCVCACRGKFAHDDQTLAIRQLLDGFTSIRIEFNAMLNCFLFSPKHHITLFYYNIICMYIIRTYVCIYLNNSFLLCFTFHLPYFYAHTHTVDLWTHVGQHKRSTYIQTFVCSLAFAGICATGSLLAFAMFS